MDADRESSSVVVELVRTAGLGLVGLFALASIVVSIAPFWNGLAAERDRYGPMTSYEREHEAGSHEDFDARAWDVIKSQVGHGDRYVVIGQPETTDDARRENLVTRTYAGYWLLPAIQVLDPADADVAIWVRPEPRPARATCFAGLQPVCVRHLR